MSEFGNRLRVLRNKKGLSAEEAARQLQVAASTYRDWENGRLIKGEPYAELARIFDVSLSELFGVANEQSTEIAHELKKAEDAIKRVRLLL